MKQKKSLRDLQTNQALFLISFQVNQLMINFLSISRLAKISLFKLVSCDSIKQGGLESHTRRTLLKKIRGLMKLDWKVKLMRIAISSEQFLHEFSRPLYIS
jgi:hypothetical protein